MGESRNTHECNESGLRYVSQWLPVRTSITVFYEIFIRILEAASTWKDSRSQLQSYCIIAAKAVIVCIYISKLMEVIMHAPSFLYVNCLLYTCHSKRDKKHTLTFNNYFQYLHLLNRITNFNFLSNEVLSRWQLLLYSLYCFMAQVTLNLMEHAIWRGQRGSRKRICQF